MTELHEIDGLKVLCREGTCDRDVAQSCIVEDEYRLRQLAIAGETMIDLGAYCGHASLLAASLGMRCIAVEPLPDNLEILRQNIALNRFEDLISVVPAAIGSTTMFCSAVRSEFAERHRFVVGGFAETSDAVREFPVKSISLDEILAPLDRVHILKSDCEGGEWLAFLHPKPLQKVRHIVGECHPLGGNTFADLAVLLGGFRDVSKERGYEEGDKLRLFAFENNQTGRRPPAMADT